MASADPKTRRTWPELWTQEVNDVRIRALHGTEAKEAYVKHGIYSERDDFIVSGYDSH